MKSEFSSLSLLSLSRTKNSTEQTARMDASRTSSSTGNKSNSTKLLNPWMLHFQKLALELKCPLCLSLFKRPVLLPCNHLFCNSCLADFTTSGSECVVCNAKYAQSDIRHVPFVENVVGIYRSLEATFSASLFTQHSSDVRVLEPCQGLQNSVHRSKDTDNVGAGKNQKRKMSGIAVHDKGEEIEMYSGGQVENPRRSSQMKIEGREDSGVVEMDVNQGTQSAPASPPFCDTKGSENDCSDQDSEHLLPSGRLENSSSKRASTGNGNLKERMTQLRSESSASETEGLTRELKRQKNLTHGNDQLRTEKDPGAVMLANVDDSYISTCSFCQSSKISEATGPMLHCANGNLVIGDAAKQPNVIHVHKVCSDWAPQVYFVGETLKNLKTELSRAAKLKCSKCGLKGAALGCYVKSCRRTYHAPCAMDVSNCRWDYEGYLMLCPGHSHVKFPSEKSKSRKQTTDKHPTSSHLPSQCSSALGCSKDEDKKLLFCGSALSTEEKILLINFASKIGAKVTKIWTSEVTHVIAATDENGACSRTLKVLMAILNGKWVLKMDWVKASMEEMNPLGEEPYEITLDNQGCHGGPKAGRLRAMVNEPKLFTGLKFYLSGDYVTTYKKDIEELIEVGGGAVLRSKEELEAKKLEFEGVPSKFLVVYNLDPPQGCKLGEEVSIIWQRMNDAEELASSTGSEVIGHTWILESIAACKLQPFVI
ncbi:BRCA1-associated RING domain protein 1 [Arachis hypogaea]|uniref:BRCA1-associated RING domain protein 1 n=1 Tax=Arachis hypogaea TaxID=3818 RepID=UPI000DECC515|nr:BRCA1-associated RING domain protein 1 [Arachis hypogaea]